MPAARRYSKHSANGRVSLRTIAEEAKTSRMTVSLALRGHPSISLAQRKRIQKLARRLGYTPNPIVTNLMGMLRAATHTKNTVSVAIVTNQFGDHYWRKISTHVAYFEGARDRALSLGYKTEEFRLFHDGMTERRLRQILTARGIQGAVFLPTVRPDGLFELNFDCTGLSVATTGYSLSRPIMHRSCINHLRLIMEACRQLRALGYRRLGLATEEGQDRRSGRNWRAGFLAAENLLPGGQNVPALIPDELTFPVFRSWFMKYRPDAVLHLGPPIIEWIERCGASVPGDVGYVSLDLQAPMGDISGMSQHSEKLGAAAIDLVIGGIGQNEFGEPPNAKIVMIDGSWRAGSTTRLKLKRKLTES